MIIVSTVIVIYCLYFIYKMLLKDNIEFSADAISVKDILNLFIFLSIVSIYVTVCITQKDSILS